MIDSPVLERVLSEALRHGGEFAEVFAEDKSTSSAMLDDGRVEELSSGRERGAGIRVISGETTGFAHTADLSEAGLLRAAEAASAVARGGAGGTAAVAVGPLSSDRPDPGEDGPTGSSRGSKADTLELLRRADEAARASGGAISQVQAGCGASRRRVLIANSDGLLAGDEQARSRFSVSCVATADTGLQTGFESAARTLGFEMFDEVSVAELAELAANRALSKLTARPAPSGELPVVLAGGSGGILFHEACGHGLEADHIVKDASVYTGMVGQLVASPLVTLVDDGTVGSEWGTFAVDDEGRPAQRNVLIDHGVLTDYLWDYLRARKEGRVSSGNGRRQTYQHLPMVRMTNTFLLPGEEDPDEIVAQTPAGGVRGQAGRRPGQHDHRRLRVRDHRGLSDRRGQDHRAAAGCQPDRQRAGDPQAHRRGGHRLRHDPRHLRQGRPERSGRVRPGHTPVDRRHHRGDRGMSTMVDVNGSRSGSGATPTS